MRLKYILLILIAVSLSACWQNKEDKITYTKNSVIQTKWQINSDVNRQIESKTFLAEQKIQQENYKKIKKNNPKVIEEFDIYNKSISELWKEIGTNDKRNIENTLWKVMPYIIKYEKLKKDNSDPIKLDKYKKFIIKNFKKEWIKIDDKKLNKLVSSNTYKKVYILRKKLSSYILPDWTITTPEFKQSFEEFKKQQLNLWWTNDEALLEEFKKQVITEQATMEWKCDEIENEMDRAYCKYEQKSK